MLSVAEQAECRFKPEEQQKGRADARPDPSIYECLARQLTANAHILEAELLQCLAIEKVSAINDDRVIH